MDRRGFMAGCLGLPLLAQARGVQAQAGLTKIIFPFAAGAGGDTLCRLIAQEMAPVLQRTIVVENRTGGDGLIGIKAVKGASPDGSMVLVTTGPTMYLLPMVETTPSFDTAKDFVPVSLLARFDFAVVVGPAVDAKDFKGLVAWLKAHPDKTSFGVPSNGTIPHFTGSKLEKDLGIPLSRVPYRGSAPILNDLIGGHIQFMFSDVPPALPLIAAGKLRALGVTTKQRVTAAPEIAPLAEVGMPGFDTASWHMVATQGQTPKEIVERLNAEIRAIMDDPEVKRDLIRDGAIPQLTPPPDELKAFVKSEITRWGKIVAQAGIAGTE